MPAEGYAVVYGASKTSMPHMTARKPIKSIAVAVKKAEAYQARYPNKKVAVIKVSVAKYIHKKRK